MVASMSTCSANSKVQFALLKVVNLYLLRYYQVHVNRSFYLLTYSSRQKLLDSNLLQLLGTALFHSDSGLCVLRTFRYGINILRIHVLVSSRFIMSNVSI